MDYLKLILNKSKWSTLSAIILIISQVLIYLIVTRFVDTKELGNFALASSLVFIAVGIIDFSFSSSLIHSQSHKEEDYKAVLNINLICSLLAFVLIMILAVILGHIYDSNLIFSIALFLSPILFFNAFNNVHFAGLKKDLKFDQIARMDFFSAIISFVVFILALKVGLGLWSLVFAFTSRYFILSSSLILGRSTYCNFGLSQNNYLLKKHFDYGKYILAEKGLYNLLSYADIFLVGTFLGMSTLGIYDVLKKIVLRPLILLYTAVENVVFPLLSKNKDNLSNYKNVYKQFLSLSNFFFIPLLTLVFVFSDYLLLLLPEEYQHSHSMLKALAVLGISIIIFNPTDILLYSQGKTKLFMKWMLAYSLPLLAIMFITVQINVVSFIYALSASYLLLYALAYFVLFRNHKSISVNTYFTPIATAILMLSLVYLCEKYLDGALAIILSTSLVCLITVTLFFLSTRQKVLTSDQF